MLHWIILVTQWDLWEWVYIYSCPPRLPSMFNVCFIHWFFDIFCFFTDSSSLSFYSCSLLIYMLQPVVFLGHTRLWGLYSLILLCISNSVRSDWDTIRPLQICWSGFMSEFSLFRSRISGVPFFLLMPISPLGSQGGSWNKFQLYMGEGLSRHLIALPIMSIWECCTLLKCTLVFHQGCLGTSPCCQNTFHVLSALVLEPRTFRFSAQSPYHRSLDQVPLRFIFQ